MRYDLGRFRRPMRRSTEGQLASLVGLGDGSTLSLDFTAMSGLDSRFTFSRSSTATVINSSGLVQWAAANLVYDTEIASAPPVPWNPFTATGGSNTLSNGVVVSASGSSGRAFYRHTLINLTIGLQYSLAVEITAQSGGESYVQSVLPAAAGVTGSAQYYVNGSPRNSGDAIETGLVCVVWTAAATSLEIRIGVGANSGSVNKSVTWTKPRAVPGNIAQPAYFANSSTTATYQAPRFDHDPTTLAPRGLLIEGSVTNLVLQSDTLPTTNWAANAVTRTNVSTVTPDGNTTATTCGLSHTGAGSFRSNPITVTASTAYTFSFWAKNNGGSVALYRAYNVSGSADIVAETSYFSQINGSTWTRVQFTFTTPVGCTSVYVYPLSQSSGTSNVLIWGAQLEAGSGASSYIPTGASTVQRAADVCTMSGTNFSSWFNSTAGTFLATGERAITGDFGRLLSANANNTTSAFDLGASTTGRWLITNTTSQADITAGTVTANTAFKVAGAFANNDAQMAFNGTLGTADTSVSLPTVSQLDIGADRTAVYLNGRIRSIKFWPTRLTNATLQSLTQ